MSNLSELVISKLLERVSTVKYVDEKYFNCIFGYNNYIGEYNGNVIVYKKTNCVGFIEKIDNVLLFTIGKLEKESEV